MGHCYSPERCFFKTVKPGFPSAAASLLLVPTAAMAQPQVDPLAEPLTRDELKPTYFAIVECARRNQEPGCLAARELADELMDRPFVTALCKDTAFAVTQQAKTAETNSFEPQRRVGTPSPRHDGSLQRQRRSNSGLRRTG